MPDTDQTDFDLDDFLPYLLNQAAEAASRGFQDIYRRHYGMSRTQWRIMANLGKFGAMTARDICAVSHIEKTKVSRAVAAMERDGILTRIPSVRDRRAEDLSLTPKGMAAFSDLGQKAIAYDQVLRRALGTKAFSGLNQLLRAIIATQSGELTTERP